MLSFFPRGVLDGILNLIESVSEGFPSYFCGRPTLALSSALVPQTLSCSVGVEDS